MFENIIKLFKNLRKKEKEKGKESSDTAKERLHLVLMQDRANVSADFLELMRKEIIEVIKKYIDIDESSMDVRLTNKTNEDGTVGAPALYANIPIVTIKEEARKANASQEKEEKTKTESVIAPKKRTIKNNIKNENATKETEKSKKVNGTKKKGKNVSKKVKNEKEGIENKKEEKNKNKKVQNATV